MSSVDMLPVVVPLALVAPLPLSSPLVLPELLVLVELPELPELLVVDVIGCGPLVKLDDATVSPQLAASSRAAPRRASRGRVIARLYLSGRRAASLSPSSVRHSLAWWGGHR